MNREIKNYPFSKLSNHISKDFTTLSQIFVKLLNNSEGFDPQLIHCLLGANEFFIRNKILAGGIA